MLWMKFKPTELACPQIYLHEIKKTLFSDEYNKQFLRILQCVSDSILILCSERPDTQFSTVVSRVSVLQTEGVLCSKCKHVKPEAASMHSHFKTNAKQVFFEQFWRML